MSGLFDSLMRTLRHDPQTTTGPALGTTAYPGAPFMWSQPEPSHTPYYSATGQLFELAEAGRELLKEIEECQGTTASPSPDILQRFRDLVENG